MKERLYILALLLLQFGCTLETKKINKKVVNISKEELSDRIKGGLAGQLLGNLNGMPYEELYNDEAGTINNYIPSLSTGAYTDDDTDEEWSYLIYMQKNRKLILDYDEITEIWRKHFNRHIYSSVDYGRSLIDIGIGTPLTGNCIINPWSDGYMSGQITCEAFGLASPCMCESAEKIALHYVACSGSQESFQSTQLFTSMIAASFLTNDLNKIIETGLQAMDTASLSYKAIRDVFRYHNKYPNDWQMARNELRKDHWFVNRSPRLYSSVQSKKSVKNAAATILALLYGNGDFIKSLEISFNLGMDADCNAATVGTILGTINGYKSFEKKGWEIKDIYCNNARDELPLEETITDYANRILEVAEMNIIDQGGQKTEEGGKVMYSIFAQPPKVLKLIIDEEVMFNEVYNTFHSQIDEFFKSENNEPKELVKYLYLSLCIRTAEDIRDKYPEKFKNAVNAVSLFPDFNFQLLKAESLQRQMAKSVGIKANIHPSLKGNVKFELDGYVDADYINIGGSFNNWRSYRTPMQRVKGGWLCRIDLPPGKYTYKFQVFENSGLKRWVFDQKNDSRETDCAQRTNNVLIVSSK